MSNGYNDSGFTVISVEDDIPAVPEIDQPLPELIVHFDSGSAYLWRCRENVDLFSNDFYLNRAESPVLPRRVAREGQGRGWIAPSA